MNVTLVVVTSSLNSTRCMCNNLLPSSPRRDTCKKNAETRQLLIEELVAKRIGPVRQQGQLASKSEPYCGGQPEAILSLVNF